MGLLECLKPHNKSTENTSNEGQGLHRITMSRVCVACVVEVVAYEVPDPNTMGSMLDQVCLGTYFCPEVLRCCEHKWVEVPVDTLLDLSGVATQ